MDDRASDSDGETGGALRGRNFGGKSKRLWCKIIQSCWCTFHSVTSFHCLYDASTLLMSTCVFLLRFSLGRRGRGGAQSQPAQQRNGSQVRSELKNRDQILKQRKRKAKQQFLQSGGMKKLRAKGKQRLQEVMRSGFGRGGYKKGKMRKKL